jgi:hypothetical protein
LKTGDDGMGRHPIDDPATTFVTAALKKVLPCEKEAKVGANG